MRAWIKIFHDIVAAQRFLPHVQLRDVLRGTRCIEKIVQNMKGRYCGCLGDRLAQYCTVLEFVRSTGKRKADSIEIGTLFGGSCLAKLTAMRMADASGRVVCIDPMDGFYGRPVDEISGLPVTRDILYENLRRFSFSVESIELRQTRSTVVEAWAGLAEEGFASLMIDGDHTREGVSEDWRNYSRFVSVGGFVLFDDYDEPSWPGVRFAVDSILESLPDGWRAEGILGRTMILRRTGVR